MREADYKNNGERLKHRMARQGLRPHRHWVVVVVRACVWGWGGVDMHVYCKSSLGSNFIVLFVSPTPLYV